MSDAIKCCVPGCSQTAVTILRITPRRTDTPLCLEIKRALAWPGLNLPCDVAVCSRRPCQELVKLAAQTILKIESLSESPEIRTVRDAP